MAIESCNSDRLLPPNGRYLTHFFNKRRRISLGLNAPSPMISNLENDLLAEILVRVPEPRICCRCKLVCKQWKSVISDPCFVRRFDSHHRRGELNSKTPLMSTDSILSFIPVPVKHRSGFRILDSFKDLVLCGFSEIHQLGRSYLLCNPSTKQWISLPVAPKKSKGNKQAEEPPSVWWNNVLSVWRLEEDRNSWSRQHEDLLQTSRFESLHTNVHSVHHLHPEKSEIVFLEIRDNSPASAPGYAILSCNLKTRNLKTGDMFIPLFPCWTVFKPSVSCWPTPIPRYEELRGMYNGSYKWLVQSSNNEAMTTPSLPQ